MISERDYAAAAAATYTDEPTWAGKEIEQSIRAHRSIVDGVTVIAFRGSRAPLDWALDFLALATVDFDSIKDLKLGLVHSGFLMATRAVFGPVAMGIGDKPYALVGHSLGGAIALLTAGRMICEHRRPPVAIRTFGAPRVGLWLFTKALSVVPDIIQYRYGDDPVPGVPSWFKHVRPLSPLAPATKLTNPLAYHHISNYLGAVS